MIIPETYERETFRVEAVRVTSTNMVEVAEWCGGRIVDSDGNGRRHIHVPTGKNEEKIAHAFIGNWVTTLVNVRSFRVYKEKSFIESFRGIMSESEKFAKVHEILLSITRAQDSATFFGDTSGDIMLLVEKSAREICRMM